MKVVVIKQSRNENMNDAVINALNNIRHEDTNVITETDIKNSIAFKKTQAAINVLDTLMALDYVDTNNQNKIDKELFDKYVTMGNLIDSFFENLINDYIIKHDECDCECEECNELACCGECALDCDIECGQCEHCTECNNKAFSENTSESEDHHECDCESCDYCDAEEIAEDAFKLVSIFKPAFTIEDVKPDDKEITITMTGKEYLEIKDILDMYEIGDDEDDC